MGNTFPSDIQDKGEVSTSTTMDSTTLSCWGLVDADYKFIWFDIASCGSSSDSRIFLCLDLVWNIVDNTNGFPLAESLVEQAPQVEYFFIGGDAFPLRTWLMKPLSCRSLDINELIFNYRLSHGRRMVENSFEILASRFWVLQSTVHQEPSVVKWIFTACVVLLKLLRMGLGRGQFLVDNMGFNLDNVLQGNRYLIMEKTLPRPPRQSKLFWQITSGMKDLCLGWYPGYDIWTLVKNNLYTSNISIY